MFNVPWFRWKMSEFEEEKELFANDIINKDDKLSAFGITVEKLIRMRKKTLEVDIMMMISWSVIIKDAFDMTVEKLKNEKPLVEMILWRVLMKYRYLIQSRLTQFQNDKESFMNDLLKNDEELSVLKINVEKLQHEKKVLAEGIMMRDGVSSM